MVDVLVATVGQRDVARLPATPAFPNGLAPADRLYDDPYLGRRPNLRFFGQRAAGWLASVPEGQRQARARGVDLPVLDRVVQAVAPPSRPHLVLVATDQDDPNYRPGDSVEVARFVKQVMDARHDERVASTSIVTIEVDPSQPLAVVRALPQHLVPQEHDHREGLHVGVSVTGGTPALSIAVLLRLAAQARVRGWRVSELRADAAGRVSCTDVAEFLEELGLAAPGPVRQERA